MELIAEDGGARFEWHAVQPDGAKLPTRRDHAACATSPNQFAVVGGYDGKEELMDVNIVTVQASAGPGPASFSASHRLASPRNRAPPGRSHHSATHHEAGRSLYVFGGYSSSRGHLAELLAFHLDQQEWWQPDTTGDHPPPRRNHVAALVGSRLYVHGGFNGSECLADTWALDLETWHWQCVEARGPAPRARRGHAAEVLDDRYLVVHGGYNGATSSYLADAYVLDTHTGAWSALDVQGGAANAPAPRAHHTLTLMGHVLVAVGGSGPLGPLPDVHVLESPALTGALAQQHKLVMASAQLVQVQAGMADTEAALEVTRQRALSAEHQLQTLKERSADLLASHNTALAHIQRLKDKVAHEQRRVAAAEAAQGDVHLQVATLERRLRRTRQGGHEVARAAQDMHDMVCNLREEAADLRLRLQAALLSQDRGQATSLQLSAERQLLQQQLAASQQEAALLRGMLASSEAEFRHALDRQREALRGDLDATRGQLQATQRAAAAAAAAVQPEPSAEPAPPPAQRQPQQEQQEQREAVVPGAGLDLDSAALHQLAACVARAETAEVRLHSLEREHGALQAEGGTLRRQLQQQKLATEAAETRSAAALQHMHSLELQYQLQVDELQRQLVAAQQGRWRRDLGLATQQQGQGQQQVGPLQPLLPADAEPVFGRGQLQQQGQQQQHSAQQVLSPHPVVERTPLLLPVGVADAPSATAAPEARTPTERTEGDSDGNSPSSASSTSQLSAAAGRPEPSRAPPPVAGSGGDGQHLDDLLRAASAGNSTSDDDERRSEAAGQQWPGGAGPDNAGPPPPPGGVRAGAGAGAAPQFTVAHEAAVLVAHDLQALPEVARLLQLHRELLGDGT